MTVRELIEELKICNPDAVVWSEDECGDPFELVCGAYGKKSDWTACHVVAADIVVLRSKPQEE